MKKLLYLMSVFIVFAIKPIYGSPSPVTHSHDERSHTHIIPDNNHSHNQGYKEEKYTNNFSKIEINSIKELLEEDILFAFDKSKINPSYDRILYTISKYIVEEPDYVATVRAYTDSIGKSKYNKKLSQKRANSVKAELVRYDVPSKMVRAIGYGESQKYSNLNSSGRAKNRRAEIELRKGNIRKVYPLVKREINLVKPLEVSQTNNIYNTNENSKVSSNSYKKNCSYSEVEQYSYVSCAAKIGGCSIASSLLMGQSPKAVKYVSGKGCDALLEKTGFSSTHQIGEKEKIGKVVAELSAWASILFPDSDWATSIDPKIQLGSKVPSYFNCVEHSLKQNVCF